MLVVRGGEMTIHGTLVRMVNAQMLPIRNNGRFLIFMDQSDPKARRFTLNSGTVGLFEIIDDSTVEPLLHPSIRGTHTEVSGLTFEQISQRVRSAVPPK
jgi:hypothetical protein